MRIPLHDKPSKPDMTHMTHIIFCDTVFERYATTALALLRCVYDNALLTAMLASAVCGV